MQIRPARANDLDAVWAILEPPMRAGEVFALPRDVTREDAFAWWCAPENAVFVADVDGDIVGTSYIHANARGGGEHVANCGYATAARAGGRGVASALCAHSIEVARAMGFRAIQFNFVVSTNVRAIGIWERAGFRVVGRLPGAFRHPTDGYVDALIMFLDLCADAKNR